MFNNEWEAILNGQEIRQNLSKIREMIKAGGSLQQLYSIIKDNEERLIELLASEDAKTRKNTALLMGDLGQQQFLAPIWEAYKNESQRFVKSAYLSAVGSFDYHAYQEELKVQLECLKTTQLTAENEKHVMEEMRELSTLIIRLEGVAGHTFIGWNHPYDIVLITNRNFTDIVGKELLTWEPDAKIKTVGAGVRAHVEHLNWMREIRTYQELLFLIPGMSTCPMDFSAVAETIVNSQLLTFLAETHDGNAPYYFRLEMKTKRSLKEKSAFLKKLSAGIEKSSDRKLINSTENYEFEIRLIEDKQGNCNMMIKLFSLKDQRFTYRKEVIPTSIKPVNAALTVALAKDYMEEDAQVLDPFCGVGTMLIERHKAVRAYSTYGIDVQEEAILKARKNTEVAKQVIHYVNRDFLQFKHDYLFDEVITDMPFEIGRITEDEVVFCYQQFFQKIPQHLKAGALVVLYSHNKNFVKQMIVRTDFRLLEEYEISKREETYVFILRYR